VACLASGAKLKQILYFLPLTKNKDNTPKKTKKKENSFSIEPLNFF
jgi:hypothetical protein